MQFIKQQIQYSVCITAMDSSKESFFEEIIDLIVAKKAIQDTCIAQLDWGTSR